MKNEIGKRKDLQQHKRLLKETTKKNISISLHLRMQIENIEMVSV